MFTGLVTAVGHVHAIEGDRLRLSCPYKPETIQVGGSVACDGCCLTATAIEALGEGDSLFDVTMSHETRAHTTLGQWQVGRSVNLERPLRLADELGGHLVQGHVDGIASIVNMRQDGDSVRYTLQARQELARFIAPKGSVALNGVSLTVNEVEGVQFGVNIIPHTLAVTNWGDRRTGDVVNLEVDLLARYVARISDAMKDERSQ